MQFSRRVSKEDPDVLKVEENKRRMEEQKYLEYIESLVTELRQIEKYIEEHPTDFVAWKRKTDIEEMLNSEK